MSSNKRRRLGNFEDDEGQLNSTPSVADHNSPQNSQNLQSQEGGCGPGIDVGEDVTRMNIDDQEMEFMDTGSRNEYDVRTTTNIRNVPSVSKISHRTTILYQTLGVWKTVLKPPHLRTI